MHVKPEGKTLIELLQCQVDEWVDLWICRIIGEWAGRYQLQVGMKASK